MHSRQSQVASAKKGQAQSEIKLLYRFQPNQLMRRNNHSARIDPSSLPSSEGAVQLYEQFGGSITQFTAFGQNPLSMQHARLGTAARNINVTHSLHHFFTNLSMGMLTYLEKDYYTLYILAHTWLP